MFVRKYKTVYFFPAKASLSSLWTISLDRVITVLSNNGGVEENLIGLRGRKIRPNQKTQFPLQDNISTLYL